MTPLAQQLAMAKLDGWREAFPGHAQPHPETKRGGILLPYKWVNERTHERRMELPDLNAVHGVEALLKWDDYSAFDHILTKLTEDDTCSSVFNRPLSGTASLRTSAILVALGKWTD